MKLKKFRVTNFRSVMDSGWIECDDVTSLVGINEAGKSNIILALWKLNPARDGEIDSLHDMPNKEYTNWRSKKAEIVFISAFFELDSKQKNHLKSFYGKDVDSVSISRRYDGVYPIGFYDGDSEVEVKSVTKTETKEGGEKETTYNPRNYVLREMPKFVYYSNYGNLDAQIYLPHAVKLLNGEKVDGFNNDDKVRTLRVLFEYVGLEPEEVLELGKDPQEYTHYSGSQYTKKEITADTIEKATKSKEERTTLLNSASAKLTKDFKEWWKQGEYRFRLQADGDFFKIWVSDDKRPEEIELERRSTGLQWFLSFYLTFLVESQEAHEGAILLLDEAGLTLHPMAQKDLAKFFESLSATNPIIHTTHSPFLIDTTHIDRVKVVYSDEDGLTVASSDLRASDDKRNEQSIYAVHSALGLTVSDILLQGCQPVIVEGTSDQCYLNAIKLHLLRNKKFSPKNELVFIPSGGVKGVPGITSIISGRNGKLPCVILDSDKSGQDAKNKLKSSLYSGEEKKLLEIGTFTQLERSEVEDIIPFTIMEKQIDRLFREVEDAEFADEYDNTAPILPQIEKFALEHNVELEHGWKVVLARNIKRQMERKVDVDKEAVDKWVKLFNSLNKE
jgi:predicted ATP-dependent endonuclease of OLD family